MGLLCTDGFLMSEEIGEHLADAVGGQVAVGNFADLHGGRQRATAQTGNSFDGEQFISVGVGARFDLEIAMEGVVDLLCALDVAGCADTYPNDVFAGRAMPELVVER